MADIRNEEQVFVGPRCYKCGAEITTGLMAAFCPKGKECEFYTPDLDDFMGEFGLTRDYDKTTQR